MQGSPALNPMTPEELHPSGTLALPTHTYMCTYRYTKRKKEGREGGREPTLSNQERQAVGNKYIRLQEKQGQSPELGQDIVH